VEKRGDRALLRMRALRVAASSQGRADLSKRIGNYAMTDRSGAEPSAGAGQYWSCETISPPALVPKYQTTGVEVLDLRNRTDPSAMATLPPPGW